MQSTAEELIARIQYLQDQRDSVAGELKTAQATLCDLMREEEVKTFEVEDDEKTVRATYVSTTRTTVDEDSLRKAVGAVTFNKVSTRKLDKSLLEKAILSGEVDARIVAQNTSVVTSSPYVRITESAKQ